MSPVMPNVDVCDVGRAPKKVAGTIDVRSREMAPEKMGTLPVVEPPV
jgi:hypothetical protein